MTSPTTTLKDELAAAENAFWEALRTRNAMQLGELTADAITLVMADGISEFSRDEFVTMMTAGELRLEAFTLDMDRAVCHELAPGVAAITYGAHTNSRRDGMTHRTDSFNSSTWLDVGGRWMCAWATESLLTSAHESVGPP